MTRSVYVRCEDRMVFPINPETLEPTGCSRYDPYCYSDPMPDVDYIGHAEWRLLRANRPRRPMQHDYDRV